MGSVTNRLLVDGDGWVAKDFDGNLTLWYRDNLYLNFFEGNFYLFKEFETVRGIRDVRYFYYTNLYEESKWEVYGSYQIIEGLKAPHDMEYVDSIPYLCRQSVGLIKNGKPEFEMHVPAEMYPEILSYLIEHKLVRLYEDH